MSYSVNPLNLKSALIRTVPQQQSFLSQLGQLLSEMIANLGNASFLSGILNGSASLTFSAVKSTVVDLGTITTNQVVNCAGSSSVYVRLTSVVTQTRLITLSNLPQGATVNIQVSDAGNALTIQMAGTDQNGNVYGITAWNTTSAGVTNMVSTGITLSAGVAYLFFGSSGYAVTTNSPQLDLMFV
jgi:hypothetical protein